MKTLFKIAIVLAVLNAAARGAMAAWTYYEFKDATEQFLVVDTRSTTAELADAILAKAADLNLVVVPEDVAVRREGPRTWASAAWVQFVEFFPTYAYPIRFSFTVESTNPLIVPPGRSR